MNSVFYTYSHFIEILVFDELVETEILHISRADMLSDGVIIPIEAKTVGPVFVSLLLFQLSGRSFQYLIHTVKCW